MANGVQPGHVVVAVYPSERSPPFYVDVFNQGTILSREELRARLGGMADIYGSDAFNSASVSSMLSRVARNIINAINRRPNSGVELPWFAALSCLTLLDPDNYIFGRLCDFVRDSPSLVETELRAVEIACETFRIDGYLHHMAFCSQIRQWDDLGRPPKRRSFAFALVQYRIGQVFRHRVFQ